MADSTKPTESVPINKAVMPPKQQSTVIWIVLGVVLAVVIIGGGAYLYINRSITPENTNVNIATNASNANVSMNVLTNISGINLNANTETDLKTETYQKGDHSFSLQIPSSWFISYTGSVSAEAAPFVSYIFNQGEESVYLDVSFYNNDQTYDGWTAEHMWADKAAPTKKVTEQKWTAAGQEASTFIVQTADQNSPLNINGRTVSNEYLDVYTFVPKGNRIYQFHGSLSPSIATKYLPIIKQVVTSLAFIDPSTQFQITEPSQNKKVSSSKAYGIKVTWLDAPEEVHFNDPMANYSDNGILNRDYYKVGTVTNGMYKDADVIDVLETPEGPAITNNLYRVIYDSSTKAFIYLTKYSNDLTYFKNKYDYDADSTIADLTMPQTIAIPGSDSVLSEKSYSQQNLFSERTNTTKLFHDSAVGDVYFDTSTHCYIIRQSDGIVKEYVIIPEFTSSVTNSNTGLSYTVTPRITWNDKSENSTEYTYTLTGCGSNRSCPDVVSDDDFGGLTGLQVAGTISKGQKVYEYKDTNAQALKDQYENYYVPQGETKLTYEQFVQAHPVFFWQDPFGHWIRFNSTKYIPAAECGKPVIYLYPEKDTKVNVQVAPTGGFSLTEPVYPTGGWNVTASPSGLLSDSFGFTYPYLFWEGKALNYKVPEQGFVVQRSHVAFFLGEKLAQLGLNVKESAEFMDFWVPKMQDKPYYFITFLDHRYFDQLAPLSVNPKPDTVIRVFMDYKPLDNPINVEPLKIITPVRRGFTVVEWGGALHK